MLAQFWRTARRNHARDLRVVHCANALGCAAAVHSPFALADAQIIKPCADGELCDSCALLCFAGFYASSGDVATLTLCIWQLFLFYKLLSGAVLRLYSAHERVDVGMFHQGRVSARRRFQCVAFHNMLSRTAQWRWRRKAACGVSSTWQWSGRVRICAREAEVSSGESLCTQGRQDHEMEFEAEQEQRSKSTKHKRTRKKKRGDSCQRNGCGVNNTAERSSLLLCRAASDFVM